VVEPSLAPVKDLGGCGGPRNVRGSTAYFAGSDLDESRNLPQPGTPEYTAGVMENVKEL